MDTLPESFILSFDSPLGEVPLTSSVPNTPTDRVSFTRRELRRNLTRLELHRWALSNLVKGWYLDDSGFYRRNRATGIPDKSVKLGEADLLADWNLHLVIAHGGWHGFERDLRTRIEELLRSKRSVDEQFSEGVKLRGSYNLPTRVPSMINDSGIITECDFPFMLDDYSDEEVRVMRFIEEHAKKVYLEGGGSVSS
ncbi:hypothetical protein CC1G_14085 [Coprinopsis cinerea okayama7|uniref:Uncharacterized protein n=1 Tax=Coprinopsis cinerea (strain Okayama-7 / 130 / ATCC MYA-4618 / FGSC 9003) TaxID=240176 RepID=D6RLA3_COPC7|nr:hypothetical protein CC1G_14085 [Coprinopsis cinerea okayama7\|eukprot:XP_002911553.1 hypothetical protein CC1G_14085 [Coprinopsis cinerea okayama7\